MRDVLPTAISPTKQTFAFSCRLPDTEIAARPRAYRAQPVQYLIVPRWFSSASTSAPIAGTDTFPLGMRILLGQSLPETPRGVPDEAGIDVRGGALLVGHG